MNDALSFPESPEVRPSSSGIPGSWYLKLLLLGSVIWGQLNISHKQELRGNSVLLPRSDCRTS